jgi:GntR family transcriptional regulator
MSKSKYEKVSIEIQRRIHDQIYPPMSRLPDQNALAEEFGVSRVTIREACDRLAQLGFVYKQSGRGTYVLGDVAAHGDEAPESRFNGLTELRGEQHVTSDLLGFNVAMPSTLVQSKLGLTADEPVYVIDRLRKIDDQPRFLEHNFIPLKLAPGLTREVLSGSLYGYLCDELGLRLSGAKRDITATLATARDVLYLKAELGEPVLEVEQVMWLSTGENIDYSTVRNLARLGGYAMMNTYQQQ